MTAQDNQPDWDKIAEKFDLWLPHIAPVGEVLLNALGARPGERIIDLASGTGEPALTLARQMSGQLEIVGTDAAEGMVKVARQKVEQQNIPGITFQSMPAERLEFEDNSFDRALCRFGVMLFEDPLKGLEEMRRVLKPGGKFAFAVWGAPEKMTTLYWAYEVLKGYLPEEAHPPLAKVTSLGGVGVLEDLLDIAGFSEYSIEQKTFDYDFSSFDEYWNVVEASDIMKQQFDLLADDLRAVVRDEVGQFAREFVQDSRLVIPHQYLLVTGIK